MAQQHSDAENPEIESTENPIERERNAVYAELLGRLGDNAKLIETGIALFPTVVLVGSTAVYYAGFENDKTAEGIKNFIDDLLVAQRDLLTLDGVDSYVYLGDFTQINTNVLPNIHIIKASQTVKGEPCRKVVVNTTSAFLKMFSGVFKTSSGQRIEVVSSREQIVNATLDYFNREK